ncbi:MAG: response regulator transcription factor [Tissierellales bacterium]|nr:response regulator transcription factor [Tissierellales bacterium]
MAVIYAADDEKDIRDILSVFLESEGHEVFSFENGDELYDKFIETPCDLILLDIMMPGTDGLIICSKIRKISKVPIIMLTAKNTDTDYISGLALGSDDYMTKPFKPTILMAKIRALLRRVELERRDEVDRGTGEKSSVKDISSGDLKYVVKEHIVYCNGREVNLTATELKFLMYMMEHENEAISKETILNEIWGYSAEIETRVADETNRRLRKKLTEAGSYMYVQTVWGYGFKFTKKE